MSSSNPVIIRVLFVICLFASWLLLPWWLAVILTTLGVIAFNWFAEAIFITFFIDIIFSVGWLPYLSLSMLIFMLVVEAVTYYISY